MVEVSPTSCTELLYDYVSVGAPRRYLILLRACIKGTLSAIGPHMGISRGVVHGNEPYRGLSLIA